MELKVVMVSTEYPPMKGGVGRYTYNLTKALRRLGLEVCVVCDEKRKRRGPWNFRYEHE